VPKPPQVDLRDATFSPVTVMLQRLRHASERAEAELAQRLEMSVTDLKAMEHLMADGHLGPAELARRLGITTASATALVDRLEARGHVASHPVAGDRRRRDVSTTTSGEQEAFAALGPLLWGLDGAARGMSPAEETAVAAYLQRVIDAYRAYPESDRPAAPSER
jgi:DNA-binding MarR family transcriptional regulator